MPSTATVDARYVQVRLEHIDLQRAGRGVLHDVSWRISPGERWLLAGGNGAGKTQLLKLVAGAVWPTPETAAGRRYRWRRETWTTPYEVQDEIAYLGPERQDRYERHDWNHTVAAVVGTGLKRTDIPLHPLARADRARISALLARLGLATLARRRFLTLSYGERRLVLLARALAAGPGLLLLDELLSGLDPVNRRRALDWLDGSASSRRPWVLSTHRGGELPRSLTHALLLERGRVAYCGSIRRAPLGGWLRDRPARGLSARGGDRIAPSRGAGARAHHGPVRHRPEALVQLSDASVWIEGVRVLHAIDWAVRPGECWVVHGPNGSGKSTLLQTLYGDHGVAAGGRIERQGIARGVPLERFRRRVGFVAPHLQSAQPRDLSVAEVVRSGREARIGGEEPRTPRRPARDVAAALRTFRIWDLRARAMRELSYGQARRSLFARAWVGKPRLLLLDEAFAGLDPHSRRELLERVSDRARAGVAVVLATHHRDEWPRCTTHELELVRGHIKYAGRVRRVRAA